jgi:hypothetical protein
MSQEIMRGIRFPNEFHVSSIHRFSSGINFAANAFTLSVRGGLGYHENPRVKGKGVSQWI